MILMSEKGSEEGWKLEHTWKYYNENIGLQFLDKLFGARTTLDYVCDIIKNLDCLPNIIDLLVLYPVTCADQENIARDFHNEQSTDNLNMTGEMMASMPSEQECKKAECAALKFLCDRNHKYGLSCRSVCNTRGWYIDFQSRRRIYQWQTFFWKKQTLPKTWRRNFTWPVLIQRQWLLKNHGNAILKKKHRIAW